MAEVRCSKEELLEKLWEELSIEKARQGKVTFLDVRLENAEFFQMVAERGKRLDAIAIQLDPKKKPAKLRDKLKLFLGWLTKDCFSPKTSVIFISSDEIADKLGEEVVVFKL